MASVIPPGVVLAPECPEIPEEPASVGLPRPQRRSERKPSDRFESINTFIDQTMRGLSHADSLVWLVLWRIARNGAARASYGDLANRIGCHRSTVTKSLRRLREMGLVEVVVRGDQYRGPSTYRLRSEVGA